jgi:hypothetical protein
MAASEAAQEVLPWLKTLPLAPEYHPTLSEFQDPISYIFKIEKEASKYGICKIVPPVPPSPKKTAIANLNRSLSARNPESEPTFTTRQQQIGFCPRRPRPVQRPVWQSGEYYTFEQFEAKAKAFEKSYLKKCGGGGKRGGAGAHPSALEIETLYWKATVDKPFSGGGVGGGEPWRDRVEHEGGIAVEWVSVEVHEGGDSWGHVSDGVRSHVV